MITWVPSEPGLGVYETEQLLVDGPVETSMHGFGGVKVPELLLEKLTGPVGVVAPIREVSVTVAVQLVGLLTGMEEGMHWTTVDVGCSGNGETVEKPWLTSEASM